MTDFCAIADPRVYPICRPLLLRTRASTLVADSLAADSRQRADALTARFAKTSRAALFRWRGVAALFAGAPSVDVTRHLWRSSMQCGAMPRHPQKRISR
jgi:hypothetical protein